MAAKEPGEYTVPELKEILRENNLLLGGSKAELIKRLTDFDVGIWDRLNAERVSLADAIEEDVESNDGRRDGATAAQVHNERGSPTEDEWIRRENDLLRRERDLLQRELTIARQGRTPSNNAESSDGRTRRSSVSTNGYGAILLQRQSDKIFRPVFYFSKRTTPAEAKYHSFELECLAAVYAIKRFHIYLAGIKFRIVTDCDSFRLTLSKKTVNPRISRWALFLENYDYEIVHRPGSRMGHVDALSRCHSILILEANSFEQTLSIQQDRDEEIRKIRDKLEKTEDKYYEIRDGLVYRKTKNEKLLFYVPPSMETNVIRTCHDDIGHVGVDKVVDNITKVYWFPQLREKVKAYIANCLRCIEFSPLSGKPEGNLHSIEKEKLPFQTIHVDHCGPFEKTGRGFRHILAIVDAFTKFVKLYPCKSTTSEESIKHLRSYFQAYSKPKRIVSDRETAFTSDRFREFVNGETIKHVLVAVGTPRANGQVERFNRVITPMISKLCDGPNKWDQVLNKVEFAINNTVCRSTGETPSKLLFGVDQIHEINDNLRLILDSYSNDERDLVSMREVASMKICKNQEANERYYNRRHKEATRYNEGDYVMIRNVDTTAGSNKKLIPKFKGPYIVKKVLDSDRYVVTDVEGFELTQLPYTGMIAVDQIKSFIRE